jgi:hypothetical protein
MCVSFVAKGINLKAKFNPISKWQKLQGAHTEIVVYEDAANKKTGKLRFDCDLRMES